MDDDWYLGAEITRLRKEWVDALARYDCVKEPVSMTGGVIDKELTDEQRLRLREVIEADSAYRATFDRLRP